MEGGKDLGIFQDRYLKQPHEVFFSSLRSELPYDFGNIFTLSLSGVHCYMIHKSSCGYKSRLCGLERWFMPKESAFSYR